jgi:hypothetical protein
MVEGIGPEGGAEISTSKYSAKGSANGLMRTMGTLSRAILVRGIRVSELDLISKVVEGNVNIAAFAKLTTTIQMNVFVRAGWGVVGKPLIEPVDGRSLSGKGTAEQATTEMVSKKDITGLAVITNKVIKRMQSRLFWTMKAKSIPKPCIHCLAVIVGACLQGFLRSLVARQTEQCSREGSGREKAGTPQEYRCISERRRKLRWPRH